MSLKDIEKLKEKVDKDPNSKLFVPLAEEYRKEGMLDEAIGVLLSGIEKQPGYMSARVSLGKIYVEKAMLTEAQSEFEQVIRSIPDNLYAHKKLADIYRATGDSEQAIRSYKTVLRLNAMDEEALISLSELEGQELQEASTAKTAASPETGTDLSSQETADVTEKEPAPVVGFVAESGVSAEPIREEDLAAFQSAIFGAEAENPDDSPEDLLAPPGESYEAAAELTDPEIPDTEMTVTGNADEEAADVFELDDLQDDAFGQSPTSGGPAADAFTLEQTNYEQPTRQQAVQADTKPVAAPLTAAASADTLADADRQVSEGNYGGALTIYRTLLSADPGDRQILQRVEELRQFLKMIGKDKDAMIDQLNSFMEGIEKRRDEFHRNS
jgi:tetratricopeptide (TPR) repeat protein